MRIPLDEWMASDFGYLNFDPGLRMDKDIFAVVEIYPEAVHVIN